MTWLSRRGRWARELADRTPLRVKLVAAMLILVTTGLFAAGFAAVIFMERYLLRQVDQQLSQSAEQLARRPFPDSTFGRSDRWSGVDHPERERPALAVAFFSQIYTKTGEPVGSDDGLRLPEGIHRAPPELPEIDAASVARLADRPFTTEGTDGYGAWRVLARQTRGGGMVVVALSLNQVEETINHLTVAELCVGLAVLVTLAALGQVVIRSSLDPLMRVEATAEAIAAGDLSQRVPGGEAKTEVGRLARALNAMLAQIETAFRDREASEAAARGSEAAARASEERMRRFVADASHELRTPLTSIRGFAELLRRQLAVDEAAAPATTDRISAAAIRMTTLVEDLLLLARLDQQRPPRRGPVDLLGLVADAVVDFRVTHPDHPVTLVAPADAGSPPPVVAGDEVRLRQVVTNLLANAGEHTPAGTSISLAVGIDDDQAVLRVSDTGPGLPPEVAERVFERFYRADTSRTRASGGTGLGLSIVAALVAAHGGTSRVTSELGEGTTFEIRIPLHQAW